MAPPDADSVFRIASMTKSFTAATVLLLRDEGRLRLDDPVGRWVPDLAGLAGPTADSPPITLEHLLTMSAGFPTDDPWGDRQQGLPFDAFAALLRGGLSFAWPPGTRFEYSNLGYGILGRVITAAAGAEYKDVVRDRLLRPLGMAATVFERDEVPAGRLAHGYVKRADAWIEEPIDPYGALSSMGGVFTSVRDLTRWVAGFIDAFPPRDDPDDAIRSAGPPGARCSRSSGRRGRRSSWPSADAPPMLAADHYGYGLFVWDDLRLGRVVGHGGGYPGLRVAHALAPGIRARGHRLRECALRTDRQGRRRRPWRRSSTAERPRIGRIAPWPATSAARTAVERLLERWDDAEAESLFAMNVDLDEPLDAPTGRDRAPARCPRPSRARSRRGRRVGRPVAPGVVDARRARPGQGRDPPRSGSAEHASRRSG